MFRQKTKHNSLAKTNFIIIIKIQLSQKFTQAKKGLAEGVNTKVSTGFEFSLLSNALTKLKVQVPSRYTPHAITSSLLYRKHNFQNFVPLKNFFILSVCVNLFMHALSSVKIPLNVAGFSRYPFFLSSGCWPRVLINLTFITFNVKVTTGTVDWHVTSQNLHLNSGKHLKVNWIFYFFSWKNKYNHSSSKKMANIMEFVNHYCGLDVFRIKRHAWQKRKRK